MSVKTAKVIDPRIEPQPDPLYAVTVGPKQNQYYTIPASGISDSYITFNNLTTLGADRAYLDTFELSIKAFITFHMSNQGPGPNFNKWTFDSWPFNKCCDQVRVNINGGAFFSQPMSYVRAKERYWDEKAINDSYGNVCPCHKPLLQNETGLMPDQHRSGWSTFYLAMEKATLHDMGSAGLPVRTGNACLGNAPTSVGGFSYSNNSIIEPYTLGEADTDLTLEVTWREPIFASPFSSRIDATWGRPLYNITSMDLAFNMQDLRNMIRVTDVNVASYEIHLDKVNLCYQVMTIPPSLTPPPSTIVPYRRIVPYVTDDPNVVSSVPNHDIVTLTSGVYTLNEVPTAIWVFAGPTKDRLQSGDNDGFMDTDNNPVSNMWGNNKLFAFMKHISISCANTTQILNTATVHDLYRIAKANGCKDDFVSWAIHQPFVPRALGSIRTGDQQEPALALIQRTPPYISAYAGSVLRLIPGVDIVLPEQDLVPGSNANNMVFQVSADFVFPPAYLNYKKWSLWLLFEYVGVATISPGQCEISMNPLGDGRVMDSAPVVSATPTQDAKPETMEGSGWWDTIKNGLRSANNFLKNTGLVSKALKYIPTYGETLSNAAKSLGYGYKRPRSVTGGAVMGMGDFI